MSGARSATVPDFNLQTLDSLGVPLTGATLDSRTVKPGDLFLACQGTRSDGRHFISQAIEGGASAVLWEADNFAWDADWKVPHLGVRDLALHAGPIASHVYGHPSRDMWMMGVTGTNGKTSCSHWIAQSMAHLGRKTAVIGTLGNGFPGELSAATHTTPDAVTLQAQLADFRAQGARAIAMEVSSHGLDQGRINGVKFDVALFTNLSRDHLDYHGDMAAYGAAKARLFRWPGLKGAVINIDDAFGKSLAESLDGQLPGVLRYGLGGGDIAAHRLDLSTRGLKLEIRTSRWGAANLECPVIGAFNAVNLLGALGVLLSSQVTLQDSATALANVRPVAGRMQLVREEGAPLVVVDYAHTPDALQKVLETLAGLKQSGSRLHCVFGCGGDRDAGKRPIMGGIDTRLADRCVITSDNPRGEDPRAIIEAIASGAQGQYRIEPDRAAAIHDAIAHAAAADVILIAGKGHENYQEIAGNRFPFDDVSVARAELGEYARSTHA